MAALRRGTKNWGMLKMSRCIVHRQLVTLIGVSSITKPDIVNLMPVNRESEITLEKFIPILAVYSNITSMMVLAGIYAGN